MPDAKPLPDLTSHRLAGPAELKDAAEYALRFKAKIDKRDAGVVASQVVDHLATCGFVFLKGPPVEMFSTPSTMTEQRAADDAAREAERKRWPSWDDWG